MSDWRGDDMREEYDFSKGKKNPYAKDLKKQVTIKLTPMVIDYFKEEAIEFAVELLFSEKWFAFDKNKIYITFYKYPGKSIQPSSEFFSRKGNRSKTIKRKINIIYKIKNN